MDVSIVIVNYNTRRFLDECIQSIKRETSVSHEIIVVDNASTDDSCAMVRAKHPDVHLIENRENVGFAKANNQGFALARGRYFFMLNPDTVVIEKAIDKLIAFMDANPDVGICGPKNIGPDGSLQYSCDHFPSVWNIFCYYSGLSSVFRKSPLFNQGGMRYWAYDKIKEVERIVGCSLLIRESLFTRLSGLDEKYFMYFEETDFCYRAYKSGARTVYYPEAVIVHYGGQSTITLKENIVLWKTANAYFHESQYYYFKKNYGYFSAFLVRCLNYMYGTYLVIRHSYRRNISNRRYGMIYGQYLRKSALSLKGSSRKTNI